MQSIQFIDWVHLLYCWQKFISAEKNAKEAPEQLPLTNQPEIFFWSLHVALNVQILHKYHIKMNEKLNSL